MKRKIIQVAVSESDESSTIIALCDDGTLWNYSHACNKPFLDKGVLSKESIPAKWTLMLPIPQIGVCEDVF